MLDVQKVERVDIFLIALCSRLLPYVSYGRQNVIKQRG